MNCMEKAIQIISSNLGINWELLANDFFSEPKRMGCIEKYLLCVNIHHSYNNDTIDSLSKVFARFVSTELQLYNISNFGHIFDVFVLDRFGVFHNINIYASSKNIFHDLANNLDSNLKAEQTNIDGEVNSMFPSTKYLSETGFLITTKMIIDHFKGINGNVTIWFVIPEMSINLSDSAFATILEFIIDSLYLELQKINIEGLKINLIILLNYSSQVDLHELKNRPIIVTNQKVNYIRITCIDSRLLLNYSDVIISQIFDALLLRIDLSGINKYDKDLEYATFFTVKNENLLKFVEKKNYKPIRNKELRSHRQIEYSDSEEGEITDEHETVIFVTLNEFQNHLFDKLVDVIQLKILGKIPPQYNPTAIELLPLSSPVGRNSAKVVSSVLNSLSYESILLGKNSVSNFALISNMKLISGKEQGLSLCEISKKTNIDFDNKLIRTPLNLAIINRNSIIPLPVSRVFNYESNIRSTCYVEISMIEDNIYSFACECLKDMFIKIKDELNLNVYFNDGRIFKPTLKTNNHSYCNSRLIFRSSLIKIKEKKTLSKEISKVLSSIPCLYLELNDSLAKDFRIRFEADTFDFFKFENFNMEKSHLAYNLKIKDVKVMDVLFPKERFGYERREILESFFVNFQYKSNGRLGKDYKQDTKSIIDNIELFFQKILGRMQIFGNSLGSIATNNKDIDYLIENRNFVKEHMPKIYWLSLNVFVYSLKHVSREYCRFFYILNKRNFELQDNILVPKSTGGKYKDIDQSNSSDIIHIKDVYLNYNYISFSNILKIRDAKILENKKLNYE